jgi:Pentapeptide repeats (8 copies)
LAAGIAAVVLALAIVWALFVPLADWFAHHDVGSATGPLHETALDNVRGRLLTLGAGLFAAGALVFTARNFTVSRRTFELTEQGQVTDRYTKAIEQLGSGKLDVRIGGIYALERVARDSVRDHPAVMEVLTAFIREHSREPWPEPDPGGQEQEQSVRPDVQAAVTVVGRRDQARDVQPIDLYRAKLLVAYLTHANLSSAYLADVNLTDANLTHANLSSAYLAEANLTDANLAHANLAHANLTYANLGDANLSSAFLAEANLTHAKLTGAYLTGADLTGADLTGSVLTGARLTRADLSGANWPEDKAVPGGWKRDSNSGQLSREN